MSCEGWNGPGDPYVMKGESSQCPPRFFFDIYPSLAYDRVLLTRVPSCATPPFTQGRHFRLAFVRRRQFLQQYVPSASTTLHRDSPSHSRAGHVRYRLHVGLVCRSGYHPVQCSLLVLAPELPSHRKHPTGPSAHLPRQRLETRRTSVLPRRFPGPSTAVYKRPIVRGGLAPWILDRRCAGHVRRQSTQSKPIGATGVRLGRLRRAFQGCATSGELLR